MGRDVLQHAADDILQAVRPQDDLHDSAHILSGASHRGFMYMGLRTHCKSGRSWEHSGLGLGPSQALMLPVSSALGAPWLECPPQ